MSSAVTVFFLLIGEPLVGTTTSVWPATVAAAALEPQPIPQSNKCYYKVPSNPSSSHGWRLLLMHAAALAAVRRAVVHACACYDMRVRVHFGNWKGWSCALKPKHMHRRPPARAVDIVYRISYIVGAHAAAHKIKSVKVNQIQSVPLRAWVNNSMPQ